MLRNKIYLILFLIFSVFQVFSQEKIVLVIDAGHGGRDPGGLNILPNMEYEKVINLNIALKLGGYIEANLSNVEVIYTRTTDEYISLEDRCALANREKADFFLSIHCNYNPLEEIYGTRVHIYDKSNETVMEWAKAIDEDLRTRAGRNSKGIMDTEECGYNLFVLKHTQMPAILVEAGFMSNNAEERYLNSDWGQTLIASSLFRSFRDFTKAEHSDVPLASFFYRVQIAASVASENTNTQRYKRLGREVIEEVYEDERYRYKYYVGYETTWEGAQKLLKDVQSKGFSDAFVVSVKK